MKTTTTTTTTTTRMLTRRQHAAEMEVQVQEELPHERHAEEDEEEERGHRRAVARPVGQGSARLQAVAELLRPTHVTMPVRVHASAPSAPSPRVLPVPEDADLSHTMPRPSPPRLTSPQKHRDAHYLHLSELVATPQPQSQPQSQSQSHHAAAAARTPTATPTLPPTPTLAHAKHNATIQRMQALLANHDAQRQQRRRSSSAERRPPPPSTPTATLPDTTASSTTAATTTTTTTTTTAASRASAAQAAAAAATLAASAWFLADASGANPSSTSRPAHITAELSFDTVPVDARTGGTDHDHDHDHDRSSSTTTRSSSSSSSSPTSTRTSTSTISVSLYNPSPHSSSPASHARSSPPLDPDVEHHRNASQPPQESQAPSHPRPASSAFSSSITSSALTTLSADADAKLARERAAHVRQKLAVALNESDRSLVRLETLASHHHALLRSLQPIHRILSRAASHHPMWLLEIDVRHVFAHTRVSSSSIHASCTSCQLLYALKHVLRAERARRRARSRTPQSQLQSHDESGSASFTESSYHHSLRRAIESALTHIDRRIRSIEQRQGAEYERRKQLSRWDPLASLPLTPSPADDNVAALLHSDSHASTTDDREAHALSCSFPCTNCAACQSYFCPHLQPHREFVDALVHVLGRDDCTFASFVRVVSSIGSPDAVQLAHEPSSGAGVTRLHEPPLLTMHAVPMSSGGGGSDSGRSRSGGGGDGESKHYEDRGKALSHPLTTAAATTSIVYTDLPVAAPPLAWDTSLATEAWQNHVHRTRLQHARPNNNWRETDDNAGLDSHGSRRSATESATHVMSTIDVPTIHMPLATHPPSSSSTRSRSRTEVAPVPILAERSATRERPGARRAAAAPSFESSDVYFRSFDSDAPSLHERAPPVVAQDSTPQPQQLNPQQSLAQQPQPHPQRPPPIANSDADVLTAAMRGQVATQRDYSRDARRASNHEPTRARSRSRHQSSPDRPRSILRSSHQHHHHHQQQQQHQEQSHSRARSNSRHRSTDTRSQHTNAIAAVTTSRSTFRRPCAPLHLREQRHRSMRSARTQTPPAATVASRTPRSASRVGRADIARRRASSVPRSFASHTRSSSVTRRSVATSTMATATTMAMMTAATTAQPRQSTARTRTQASARSTATTTESVKLASRPVRPLRGQLRSLLDQPAAQTVHVATARPSPVVRHTNRSVGTTAALARAAPRAATSLDYDDSLTSSPSLSTSSSASSLSSVEPAGGAPRTLSWAMNRSTMYSPASSVASSVASSTESSLVDSREDHQRRFAAPPPRSSSSASAATLDDNSFDREFKDERELAHERERASESADSPDLLSELWHTCLRLVQSKEVLPAVGGVAHHDVADSRAKRLNQLLACWHDWIEMDRHSSGGGSNVRDGDGGRAPQHVRDALDDAVHAWYAHLLAYMLRSLFHVLSASPRASLSFEWTLSDDHAVLQFKRKFKFIDAVLHWIALHPMERQVALFHSLLATSSPSQLLNATFELVTSRELHESQGSQQQRSERRKDAHERQNLREPPSPLREMLRKCVEG